MGNEEAELGEGDLLFEEDVLRNSYSLKYWVRYIDAKQRAPARQRNMIAERALTLRTNTNGSGKHSAGRVLYSPP